MEREANNNEKAAQDLYERYLRNGGRLSESDYEAVRALLDGPPGSLDVAEVTISQVRGMAERNGIVVSPEMIRAYGLLRQRTGDDYPENDTYAAKGMKHVVSMSDQELFAEVLRLAGRDSEYQSFVEKHPHIFKN